MSARHAAAFAFAAALSAASVLVTTPCRADPAYRANAVVRFFAEAARNQFRPLCVGRPPDCPAPSSSAAFMLVAFPFNSDQLTQAAKENLDEFANALQDSRLKGRKFEIDGFADATGAEPYNLALSQRRAANVVAYLASKGLDQPYLLIPRGFGHASPRGADPYGADNRRVEARMFGAVR
jgi:outer membrane protein OmpA-like peptidoglycan-associated protein